MIEKIYLTNRDYNIRLSRFINYISWDENISEVYYKLEDSINDLLNIKSELENIEEGS
uniref:Uncharacterized protein n=1 Tax=Pithovirus LCDPAC02 TaxID=2506601 RepID=A0A481YNP7_9VIRU|nr:MAG: hypothetical protein LCDPAC02_01520 [Pithovirus LCDPAC02]